ncbi:MAG: NAD+ synthase [Gammaproteobacteria bacterium]|nr:NAD+ synthase [Gammaproteobacteria bacterium]
MRISLAQINLTVGDVPGNAALISAEMQRARDEQGADLVVFPELALCGYPPEDLLFHGGLRERVMSALDMLCEQAHGVVALVGFPEYDGDKIYNAAAWIEGGAVKAVYRKHCLPNYGVFDEARYFTPGDKPVVCELDGIAVGITICEDNWANADAANVAVAAGAQLIVSINGSPFQIGKQAMREQRLHDRAITTGVPFVYQNMVGGQDELVFDGGCCVVDAGGAVVMRAPAFEDGLFNVDIAATDDGVRIEDASIVPLPDEDELIYKAIVTGIRCYITKNGFNGVVLGLSGGIDSALCLALAVDALGADAVRAVMMPYHYTSSMSIEDAETQAQLLGVGYRVMPIADMVEATTQTLQSELAGTEADATEENIQARCRGMLLMAISNKTRRMVLTTGNKSEMAVGYATLYGDMAGGFAPIKDCTKTQVYRLARYRNTVSAAIPQRVIDREPSAELRPDQKDSDSLPPYDVLDPILDALMIEDLSVDDIAARGIDRDTVGRILDMVRRNEYKRRQSPPGVRISGRAFGRDWRYPITSGYGRSGKS